MDRPSIFLGQCGQRSRRWSDTTPRERPLGRNTLVSLLLRSWVVNPLPNKFPRKGCIAVHLGILGLAGRPHLHRLCVSANSGQLLFAIVVAWFALLLLGWLWHGAHKEDLDIPKALLLPWPSVFHLHVFPSEDPPHSDCLSLVSSIFWW